MFADKGWQWLNWVTLFFAAATWLFGFGMPETYSREILRKRARRQSRPHNLPAALSGVTLAEMAKHTVINPLRMLTYEPIVIGSSLYLGLNFAIVFQWFITVPVALNMAYDFAVQRAGLAFFAAVGGAILGAFTSTILEQAMGVRMLPKMGHNDVAPIERRLLTAMVGSFGVFASLFWIGFTAKPTVSFYSPIFGTALYVWGNFSVIVGFISWLFDAYPAQGTLSALTSAAVFRLICAGTVPVGILPSKLSPYTLLLKDANCCLSVHEPHPTLGPRNSGLSLASHDSNSLPFLHFRRSTPPTQLLRQRHVDC